MVDLPAALLAQVMAEVAVERRTFVRHQMISHLGWWLLEVEVEPTVMPENHGLVATVAVSRVYLFLEKCMEG